MNEHRNGPHNSTSTAIHRIGAETYSSAIVDAQNYMRWLISQFTPFLYGRILETGLGHGGYVDQLSPFGEYSGIDIDESSVKEAKAANPGFSFYQGDICKRSTFDQLGLNSFDSVVSINVLEHIEQDNEALSNLVDALNPGGHLMLSLPALNWLYNDLDRLAGHYRRYTRSMLLSRIADLPVQVVKLCYFNPVVGIGWWVNVLLRHNDLDAESVNTQIRLFDKFAVPLSRLIDPLTRSFFGQSITCVLKRR